MATQLTNCEIREQLRKFNYECGPVTDTTREILLKKLNAFKSGKADVNKQPSNKITDDELRSQLVSYGESVGPITDTSRPTYLKRLQRLKKNLKTSKTPKVMEDNDYDDCEPMDVD